MLEERDHVSGRGRGQIDIGIAEAMIEEAVSELATSPVAADSRLMQRKFPWGDAMDRGLANLWSSGRGETVPVTHYAEGASVGGISHSPAEASSPDDVAHCVDALEAALRELADRG